MELRTKEFYPRIVIKGWWWKMFFRKYRIRRVSLNRSLELLIDKGLDKALKDIVLYGRAKIRK